MLFFCDAKKTRSKSTNTTLKVRALKIVYGHWLIINYDGFLEIR